MAGQLPGDAPVGVGMGARGPQRVGRESAGALGWRRGCCSSGDSGMLEVGGGGVLELGGGGAGAAAREAGGARARGGGGGGARAAAALVPQLGRQGCLSSGQRRRGGGSGPRARERNSRGKQ
ncbi:hypothetical protein GQ55_9G471800 [Panicum hallii var. hallii]|uniref:Uncharacterized protein n=1 Tax=Panicum hallii var. hallii TaxID=1504633 RepID=A0A2T7CCJ5_9POAL|nr:hypothetical protein GQ55_9G471800 [Panicum hallii var. hallii]